jgi:uncharacterized protein
MNGAVSDLKQLLTSMEPVLNPVEVAYVVVPKGQPCPFDLSSPQIIGMFREQEGLTIIVEAETAMRAGAPVVLRAAWITLTVHSDLEAVGLTAAFAAALGAAGVSCNVVAAAHHDHIFVPTPTAARAMAALRKLQSDARDARGPAT